MGRNLWRDGWRSKHWVLSQQDLCAELGSMAAGAGRRGVLTCEVSSGWQVCTDDACLCPIHGQMQTLCPEVTTAVTWAPWETSLVPENSGGQQPAGPAPSREAAPAWCSPRTHVCDHTHNPRYLWVGPCKGHCLILKVPGSCRVWSLTGSNVVSCLGPV